ncbi:MAG: hypothetical protein V1885_00600 [Candidatus Brennerbacteria bacterium]
MLGLALVTLAIGLATILVYGGQDILLDRENTARARTLAEEGIYAARAILSENWAGVMDGVHGISFTVGTWAFVGTSTVTDIFIRAVYVTTTSSDLRVVRSVVTWDPTPSRSRNVELVTLAANWEIVEETGGDTGGGNPSGDWQNPRTLGSIDLGPGNSATDLDVKNKIVYLTAEASDSKKPDFFVVDSTNGQSPFIAGSVNTGPGLLAVDAAGTYAYVGNKATNAQLQVIEIANQGAPIVRASLKLQGVSGSGAVGQSVFYFNQTVYVGTKRATGPEFHIVDVSDPLNPLERGNLEVNADVNAIYVRDGVAYLATSDEEELKIVDITDPTTPVSIGGYDAPGSSEDGKAIDLAGTTLYFGRLLGGSHSDHHELHVLNVASSSAVVNLGSQNFTTDINDLRVRSTLAFLGTSDANREFQVWNVSNPTAVLLLSSFNFPQVATGVDYEDNLVYISVRSNDGLRIITSSP